MAEKNINNDVEMCAFSADVQIDMFSDTWGFNLEDLYKIAVTFYKGTYNVILDADRDVEIWQAQAKPLSLLLTYTLLILVTKLPITLTSAPGSV